MATTYRYPFSPYPTGWYYLCESAALKPGEVKPMRYFGRNFALFRTESGQAVALDAYCPHLGANIGVGGVVEGESIRCPFHKWRFGVDGRCDDVPYWPREEPPKVGLERWELHETSGLILAWFSEHGRAPTWRMPDDPDWGTPGWVGYETMSWKIRMHPQELIENVPDTAHFQYVHNTPPLSCTYEMDGHVYRQRTFAEGSGTEFRQTAYGIGLIWLENPGRSAYGGMPPHRFLNAITPIDEEQCEFSTLFLVNQGEGTEMTVATKAAIHAMEPTLTADVSIWEHKVYIERAPLVQADGPIFAVRKWCQQFYEADVAATPREISLSR